MYKENISFADRIIAGISYYTFGTVGAIWVIVSYIMKRQVSTFLQYHVYMAIFLYLAFFLLRLLIAVLAGFLSVIPFIRTLIKQADYILNSPIYMNYSTIQIFVYSLMIYLILTALLGMYSYIPWVSKIISEISNRR